jgi:hypothetical protein
MTYVIRTVACLIFTFPSALFSAGHVSAAGVGKPCGGTSRIPCDPGLFCNVVVHSAENCGAADIDGKCIKVPTVCPDRGRPVCGCDNNIYGNDYKRQMAKVRSRGKISFGFSGRCG